MHLVRLVLVALAHELQLRQQHARPALRGVPGPGPHPQPLPESLKANGLSSHERLGTGAFRGHPPRSLRAQPTRPCLTHHDHPGASHSGTRRAEERHEGGAMGRLVNGHDDWQAARIERVRRLREWEAEDPEPPPRRRRSTTMTDFLSIEAFDSQLAALEALYPPRFVTDAVLPTSEGVEGPMVALLWPAEFDRESKALKEQLRLTNPEGYAERYRPD